MASDIISLLRNSSMEQFVGIFPNAINNELRSGIINWFNEISERGLTMSTMRETDGILTPDLRKDEVVSSNEVLPNNCFSTNVCNLVWANLTTCLNIYTERYGIEQGTISSFSFKVHRVTPTGGYHMWHQEHSFQTPYRSLAWMIILEAPKSGGETEFLHQSLRIEPKVGQGTIWPAGFTHKHRGNPPLEGHKTYITGWFDAVNPNLN